MLANELVEFESAYDVQACRNWGKEPFVGDTFPVKSWRVFFFASMPDSFVSSPEKTQIEAIRRFRVYTSSENGGDQREVSNLRLFNSVSSGHSDALTASPGAGAWGRLRVGGQTAQFGNRQRLAVAVGTVSPMLAIFHVQLHLRERNFQTI